MNSISKSDIDKTFGKILKDFRVKNGYTQEVMAEKLGISLKYISRIENGYPRRREFKRIFRIQARLRKPFLHILPGPR